MGCPLSQIPKVSPIASSRSQTWVFRISPTGFWWIRIRLRLAIAHQICFPPAFLMGARPDEESVATILSTYFHFFESGGASTPSPSLLSGAPQPVSAHSPSTPQTPESAGFGMPSPSAHAETPAANVKYMTPLGAPLNPGALAAAAQEFERQESPASYFTPPSTPALTHGGAASAARLATGLLFCVTGSARAALAGKNMCHCRLNSFTVPYPHFPAPHTVCSRPNKEQTAPVIGRADNAVSAFCSP